MSHELLDNYLVAWHSRDMTAILTCFDEGIVYEEVPLGKTVTSTSLNSFILETLDKYTKLHIEVISVCTNGRSIAWEWHRTGTNKNGDVVNNISGMSMTEFKDGKVIRNRDYWSTLPSKNHMG